MRFFLEQGIFFFIEVDGIQLAFLLVFSSYQPTSSKSLPRNLDLGLYQDKKGIPFTISSNLVYALKMAVKLMNPSTSLHEAVKASKFLRNSIEEMGLETIGDLKKNYNKLIKYQTEKLEAVLHSKIFSTSKKNL